MNGFLHYIPKTFGGFLEFHFPPVTFAVPKKGINLNGKECLQYSSW